MNILKAIIIIFITFIITYFILIILHYSHYSFYNKYFMSKHNFTNEQYDYNERLHFYTKHLFSSVVISDKKMLSNKLDNPIIIPNNKHFNNIFCLNYYFLEIKYFNTLLDNNKKIILMFGDTTYIPDYITYPIFVKTYSIYNTNNVGILLPFESCRHWSPILNVDKNDIPFHKKHNIPVWRGATTGRHQHNSLNHNKANRFDLVNRHQHNTLFDIGFNKIVQNETKYKLKKSMSMRELLQYKYLIIVEGNDKASCLQWMLYSNSVVLMPKPTTISWFMEHNLKPYIHYIPLQNDFSDLEEKYNWCLQNNYMCEQISTNAKNYVLRFMNFNNERKLIKNVIQKYCNYVSII